MARSKRVEVIDISKLKNQFQSALKEALDEEFLPNVVIPEVERLIQEAFSKTISGWEGGAGAKDFPGASRKTETEPDPPSLKIVVTKKKYSAEIVAYVESYIWNLLDRGRKDRKTEKPEKFVARAKPRTIPGTLDVSNNRRYTEVVHVPPGTTIKGFKPRGWTQLIADEVKDQLSDKYPNIEFSFTLKEQHNAG